ncbi:MAG TPA: autotransporter-associated beta strand repeat-containing protein [Tepidisphaeraceae bacterium]|nr:autotransporter-associated beta strand repeat-containing protein [Tepidisphaeraceae bacterium]
MAAANLVTALTVQGVTRTWVGPASGSTWETTANWTGTALPVSADIALFNGNDQTNNTNPGTSPVSVAINAAEGGQGANTGEILNVGSLQTTALGLVLNTSGANLRLQGMNVAAGAGPLSFTTNTPGTNIGTLVLGAGSLNQVWTNSSSNTVSISSDVRLAFGGGAANFNLTLAGSGNWDWAAGFINPGCSITYNGANPTSSLTFSGNTAVGTLLSAAGNPNALVVRNGTVVIPTNGIFFSKGSVDIGAGSVSSGESGSLILSGTGSLTATTALTLGTASNAFGQLSVQDSGSLSVGSGIFVGAASTAGSTASGILNISGGTITSTATSDGSFVVGGRVTGISGGSGTINLSGGVISAASNVWIGGFGSGTVNESAGSFVAANYISLGRQAGSNGTWLLTGGSLSFTGGAASMTVGEEGTGTLNIGTSTLTLPGGLNVGLAATGLGNVMIGGTATIITSRVAGGAGQGTFNFNGGTLQATNIASTNFMTVTDATVGTFGAVINTSGNSLAITSPMLHNAAAPAVDGGLNIYGGGNLTLTGSTTFTGPININSGSLNLGNASHTAISAFSMAGGNAFGLTNNAVDTLSVNGAISLAGDTLNLEVGNTAMDEISAAGAATSTGSNVINLSLVPGQSIGSGMFTVLHAGGGLNPAAFSIGTKPLGFYTADLSSSTSTDIIVSINSNPTPSTAYWTGKTGSANWAASAGGSSTSNWSTDAAGTSDAVQVPGGNTDVIFVATTANGSGGLLTTTLDSTYSVKSLTFDVPGAQSIGSTAINTNGNSLIIGANGLNMAATSVSSGNISGSGTVVINGAQAWTNNGTQALNVSTPVNALAGATTLTIGGTGSVTINGPIGNGGGTVSLVVSNPATTLGGTSTYNGTTTINGGALIDVTGKISSETTVAAGGTLRLDGGTDSFGDANTITLAGGSTLDLSASGGASKSESVGAVLGTGVVTRSTAGVSTLLVGNTGSFSAVIQDGSGTMNFGKTGAGTLSLTALNGYSGATVVGGGFLQATEGVGFPTNGNLSMSGGLLVTSGTLTRTIGSTDSGSGKLSSSGSTGFVTDTADLTVTLQNGGSPIAWGGGGTFNASTLVFNTTGSTHNVTLNADLAMDGGSRGIIVNAGSLTWNGALSGGAGGTLALTGNGTLSVANGSAFAGAVNVGSFGESTVVRVLASDALGTGVMAIGTGDGATNAEIQLIDGAGGITLHNPTIAIPQRNTGSPGIENVSGNNTITGNIQFGFGGNGAKIQSDSGVLTLTGGMQPVAGASTRTVTLSGNGVESGSISGAIAIIQGAGTWDFSGSNNYTGGTTVSAGTLIADASSTTAFGAGTVTVNNATLLVNGPGAIGGVAATALNVNNSLVNLNANNSFGIGSVTMNGGTLNLNGTGAIGGTGSASLTVSSGWVNATVANATGSAVTISLNGGTTVMGNPQAFGGASLTVNTATLDVQTDGGDNAYGINMSSLNAGTIIANRATSGAPVTHNFGLLNMGISTSITFVGGSKVTGGVPTITFLGMNLNSQFGGTSVLNPIGAVVSVGTVNTATSSALAKTLELSGSTTGNTVTDSIAEGNNTLSVTKSGPGSWILSGDNSGYSGVTTVKGGTLELTNGSAQFPVFNNSIGADVQGGRLVLDYSGSSIAGQVRDTVHSGHIIDSVATTGVGVAYFDNGSTAVTARPDLFGDADGNNVVNLLDLNAVATDFGMSSSELWNQGDFNYDGAINIADFNLLASNFGQTFIPTPSTLPAPSALGALVPEPVSAAVFSLPLLGLRRRRRRST